MLFPGRYNLRLYPNHCKVRRQSFYSLPASPFRVSLIFLVVATLSGKVMASTPQVFLLSFPNFIHLVRTKFYALHTVVTFIIVKSWAPVDGISGNSHKRIFTHAYPSASIFSTKSSTFLNAASLVISRIS